MKRRFRLGSTSYVYPDDILPNVRKLAPIVDDVELVLFEVDEYGTNLPDSATVGELNTLARDHDLTYTVHLPLDRNGSTDRSLDKIRRACDATRALDPFAYVLHLDGRMLQGTLTPELVARWETETARALDQILAHVDASRLCVENLEAWSPEYLTRPVADKNLMRCVDVGHLWRQGGDPIRHLNEHITRTRVVHLHGIHTRDHQSLAHQPRTQVASVLNLLADHGFAGVVTLEVFNLDDFLSSKQVIEEWENGSL